MFTILVRYSRRCTWLGSLTLLRETFPTAGKSSTLPSTEDLNIPNSRNGPGWL